MTRVRIKTVKFFIAVMFCALTLILVSGVECAYADNSYSIPELYIDTVINGDGSADITETWTIDFISGSFTRFYHDISSSSLSTDENFTKISDVSVSIDGEECDFTDNTADRPEYHYNISSDRAGATLAAYVKSSGCTRTFVFRYTLDDVVKNVDGQYYLFVYRFLGAKFEKKIDKLTINITAPEGCTANILYKTSGSESVNKNQASISGNYSAGSMFKVRLRMDGGSIPGAVSIKNSQLSNDKGPSCLSGMGIEFYIFLVFVLFIIVVIVRTIIKNRIIGRKINEKGLVYVQGLIGSLSLVYTPVELACKTSGSSRYALLFQLMYMAAAGRLKSCRNEDGKLIVMIPTDTFDNDTQETALIMALKDYCMINGVPLSDSGYAVDMEAFSVYMGDNYDYLHELNEKVYASIKDSIKEKCSNKAARKQLNELERALYQIKKLNMIPIVTESDLMSSCCSHVNMVYYAYTNFHGDREEYTDNVWLSDYYYWGYLYDNITRSNKSYDDNHHSSDSSGGSGCSSCSSCSSCGGGGAD